MRAIFIPCAPLIAMLALLTGGCDRPAARSSEGVAGGAPRASASGPAATSASPTFSDYPVPPKPEVNPEFLARGKTVYELNCVACHGEHGDAKADAAAFLVPRPRDFVQANYRLRSTPTGSLPTDVDLFRAVSLGLAGTAMPPWRHMLSPEDCWAVVEYIKTFSPRFAETDAAPVTVDLGPRRRAPRPQWRRGKPFTRPWHAPVATAKPARATVRPSWDWWTMPI